MAEDEMVGWHHRLNGHESEQTPGDSEGQGNLTCCHPWGSQRSDMTQRLKNKRTTVLLFEKMYIQVFCPILDWVVFLLLSYMSCMYILEIYSLQVIWFANIFSKFFHFGYGFFCCAKAYKLIRSYFFIFAFISIALGD